MRPAFRLDMAAGHVQQPIIAYRGRRTKPSFEIAWFDELPFTVGVMPPDAVVTVAAIFNMVTFLLPLPFLWRLSPWVYLAFDTILRLREGSPEGTKRQREAFSPC